MTKLLISLSNAFAERYLKPERIRDFIQKQAETLIQEGDHLNEQISGDPDDDLLFHTMELLPCIGVKVHFLKRSKSDKIAPSSIEKMKTWTEKLEGGRIIHKGVLVAGSASMLWSLLQSQMTDDLFLQQNMELILRHVEVKRQHALSRYTTALTSTQIWEERCGYALLFSHYACIRKDWRFLNASLKLNEWLWKEFHSPFTSRPVLPLLASLVEQEYVFQEMQKCCA